MEGSGVLTVEQLTQSPALQMRLLAGAKGLGRRVAWAHVSELDDPSPWLAGAELIMTTGLGFPRAAGKQRAYVERLDDAGVAGLAVTAHLHMPPLSRAVLAAADARGFPILEVPLSVPFIAIAQEVAAAVQADSTQRLNAQLQVFGAVRWLTSGELDEERVFARLARLSGLRLFICTVSGAPLLPGVPVPPPELTPPAAVVGRAADLTGWFRAADPRGWRIGRISARHGARRGGQRRAGRGPAHRNRGRAAADHAAARGRDPATGGRGDIGRSAAARSSTGGDHEADGPGRVRHRRAAAANRGAQRERLGRGRPRGTHTGRRRAAPPTAQHTRYDVPADSRRSAGASRTRDPVGAARRRQSAVRSGQPARSVTPRGALGGGAGRRRRAAVRPVWQRRDRALDSGGSRFPAFPCRFGAGCGAGVRPRARQ